jgi:hypothetical protein
MLLNWRLGRVRFCGEVDWRSPHPETAPERLLGALRSPTIPEVFDAVTNPTTQPDLEFITSNTYLKQAQTLLGLAMPFHCSQLKTWVPTIQWSRNQSFSLLAIQQTLVTLLSGFQLSSPTLDTASVENLPALAGVVVNCTADSPEAYDFNLREVILKAGFVNNPDQVYFVEGAIAALLAAIAPVSETIDTSPTYRGIAANLQAGMTLVLLIEAASTELLLVDLPPTPELLIREDCRLRSLSYGSHALDQDIVCQLLYPNLRQTNWLQLTHLPLPGEPDVEARIQLFQQLNSSSLGQNLQTIATHLRSPLCQAAIARASWHETEWKVEPKDFQQQILLPFLQSLNRELNTLLSQSGTVAAAIRQVICVGEIAQAPFIGRWLKQKLPTTSLVMTQVSNPTHSLVVQGLAQMPFYPQLINATRHQYSNLFLLQELLLALPDRPLGLGKILQQLERRGINTTACHHSILQILEGHRAEMLLPDPANWTWLTAESQQNVDYQILRSQPIFIKHSHQYQFNPLIKDCLQRHITNLLAITQQSLQDPLSFDLQAIVPTSASNNY